MNSYIRYAEVNSAVWTQIEQTNFTVTFRVYDQEKAENARQFAIENNIHCFIDKEKGLYGPRFAITFDWAPKIR